LKVLRGDFTSTDPEAKAVLQAVRT